jgi:hypothetical protein
VVRRARRRLEVDDRELIGGLSEYAMRRAERGDGTDRVGWRQSASSSVTRAMRAAAGTRR